MSFPTPAAIGFLGGEQHHGINGDHESRVSGHALRVAHLRVTNAEVAFLLAMVDFDLPTVEITLSDGCHRALHVGG